MTIHDLSHLTHGEAYDETQTNDEIKSGDFIKVSGGIAYLDKAWPVMIEGKSDILHAYSAKRTRLKRLKEYSEQTS